MTPPKNAFVTAPLKSEKNDPRKTEVIELFLILNCASLRVEEADKVVVFTHAADGIGICAAVAYIGVRIRGAVCIAKPCPAVFTLIEYAVMFCAFNGVPAYSDA